MRRGQGALVYTRGPSEAMGLASGVLPGSLAPQAGVRDGGLGAFSRRFYVPEVQSCRDGHSIPTRNETVFTQIIL